jgi:hypothetical protein
MYSLISVRALRLLVLLLNKTETRKQDDKTQDRLVYET